MFSVTASPGCPSEFTEGLFSRTARVPRSLVTTSSVISSFHPEKAHLSSEKTDMEVVKGHPLSLADNGRTSPNAISKEGLQHSATLSFATSV